MRFFLATLIKPSKPVLNNQKAEGIGTVDVEEKVANAKVSSGAQLVQLPPPTEPTLTNWTHQELKSTPFPEYSNGRCKML